MSKYSEIGVETHGHVGLIEIRKPPLNFFDVSLINQIADALEEQLSFAIKTAPKLTIQGGTTEVLRGIIARGLGLR